MEHTTKTKNLEEALRYRRYGWLVLPVHEIRDGVCSCRKGRGCGSPGKHPRTRNGLSAATTDEEQIRKWWTKWPDANIGIATGAQSGLVVIDVDPRHGGNETLQDLQNRLGKFPPGPFVRTGGGGWHLCFKYPAGASIGSRVGIAKGIDIRADGGYIVAPPSNHASGGDYAWKIKPDQSALPELPEAWIGELARDRCHRDHGGQPKTPEDHPRRTKDIQGNRSRSQNEFATEAPDEDAGGFEGFIQRCIQKSLPKRPGTRHDQVFALARYLQGDPNVAGWPKDRLRPILKRWYELAVARLGAENIQYSEVENWWDFWEGWGEVKYPGEGGLIGMLLERVDREGLPETAMQYAGDEKIQRLVALCRELQREAGDGPFFLATSTVAERFDLGPPGKRDRKRAWRWLRALMKDDVLRLDEPGNPDERKANRYRYLGDL